MMENDILTEYVCPPIPLRDHDWIARFSYHDGDTELMGHGTTESDAVLDLMTKALTYPAGDGSESESVLNWAFEGWKARDKPTGTLSWENVGDRLKRAHALDLVYSIVQNGTNFRILFTTSVAAASEKPLILYNGFDPGQAEIRAQLDLKTRIQDMKAG